MRLIFVALLLACSTLLAGCSSGSSQATSPSPSPSTLRVPATASARGGATDLVVTDRVRAALVAAGARAKGLPASAFTGLEHGRTYLARDDRTHTLWAAAALVPGRSTAARVSVQDNGGYDLFVRPRGRAWRAYEAAMAGVAGTPCPVHIPPSVLRAWGWRAHTCRPPRGS